MTPVNLIVYLSFLTFYTPAAVAIGNAAIYAAALISEFPIL